MFRKISGECSFALEADLVDCDGAEFLTFLSMSRNGKYEFEKAMKLAVVIDMTIKVVNVTIAMKIAMTIAMTIAVVTNAKAVTGLIENLKL